LSTPRQYFAKKLRLQLMSKHVETQCWVTKTVSSNEEFQYVRHCK